MSNKKWQTHFIQNVLKLKKMLFKVTKIKNIVKVILDRASTFVVTVCLHITILQNKSMFNGAHETRLSCLR